MSTKTTKTQDLLNRISQSLKTTIAHQQVEKETERIEKDKNHKARIDQELVKNTAMLTGFMRIL